MTKKEQRRRKRQAAAAGKRLVIVGCGVTGSYAIPLAGRLENVSHITLVDRDIYTESNLRSQAISPSDVGRPKVEVMARRLRRQAPRLSVEPICEWVQDVPLGRLRADVMLSCVDSLLARRVINEICWRLRMTLLDTGVDGFNWLVRTNIYRPGAGRPCLQCAWGEDDYAAQEQVYACQPGAGGAAATNAPASLGSVAAGLLIGKCQQLLDGQLAEEMKNHQVLWDLMNHRCLETEYRVNPHCRFDHEAWDVEPIELSLRSTTMAEFLVRLGGASAATPLALRLMGQAFVSQLVCESCGRTRNGALYLDRQLSPARRRCRGCGHAMTVSGFHSQQWLSFSGTPPLRLAKRSLASIGFQPGDILTIQRGDQRSQLELADKSDGVVPHSTAAGAVGGDSDEER